MMFEESVGRVCDKVLWRTLVSGQPIPRSRHYGLVLTAIWETSGSGIVVEIKHEDRRILAALGGCCDRIDLRWTSGYVVVHDGV